MTDRAAFLMSLARHPADDTPRLVFADWLDEHDEPDLAAQIRGPGAWHLVAAALVRGVYPDYPTVPRGRYLIWWPEDGPSIHERRRPPSVAGQVRPPREWGLRCHCGVNRQWLVYSGGAWHCMVSCPPSEEVREEWERETARKAVEAVDQLHRSLRSQRRGETHSRRTAADQL